MCREWWQCMTFSVPIQFIDCVVLWPSGTASVTPSGAPVGTDNTLRSPPRQTLCLQSHEGSGCPWLPSHPCLAPRGMPHPVPQWCEGVMGWCEQCAWLGFLTVQVWRRVILVCGHLLSKVTVVKGSPDCRWFWSVTSVMMTWHLKKFEKLCPCRVY